MADQVNMTPNLGKITDLASGATKAKDGGGNFGELVKGVAQDMVQTSRNADKASEAAVMGQISDLELVQVMNEAEISLQRFTSAYKAVNESLQKILNMNI